MSSEVFTNLVNQTVDAALHGRALSEPLYNSILEIATPSWAESESGCVASALRKLGAFCDLGQLSRMSKMLDSGATAEFVEREIQDNIAQRKVFLAGNEFDEHVTKSVEVLTSIHDDERNFFKQIRNVESLMGFDQGAMSRLVETIWACWRHKAARKSHRYPPGGNQLSAQENRERSRPYDHRVHVLVRELSLLLSEWNRCDAQIIKHCGHILSAVYHSNDEDAAARLSLQQLTVLADEYVRRNSCDVIGLCWRAELACWAGDVELAGEYARKVWNNARLAQQGPLSRLRHSLL